MAVACSPGTERVRPGGIRSAARNSLLGGVGALVASAAGFTFALIAGRYLGASGAGTLFACIALAMFLITVACAGAETALLWSQSRERALRNGLGARRLYRIALVPVLTASAVLAVALWLLAPTIAPAIAQPATTGTAREMLRVTAVAVGSGPALLCLVQGTRGQGSLLPFTLIQQVGVPVARVAGLVVVVVLAVPHLASGTAVITAWVLPVVLLLPVAWWVARLRSAPTVSPSSQDAAATAAPTFGEFWRYSLPRGIGTAASLALNWLDVVIVAVLASPAAAGAYAAASRFATSGQLGLQAMRLGIAPGVAAAFAHDDKRQVGALYNLSAQGATLVSWPIFWTLVVFAEPALGWFGDGFTDARPALVLLSLAMLVSVALGNVTTLLLMSGHSGWATRNTLTALAVTVGLDLALVPGLGATGAAIGWTAGVLTENGLGLWLVVRRLGIRPDVSTWIVVALSVTSVSLAASGLAAATLGVTSIGLVAAGALSLLGTAGVTFALRRRLRLDLLRRAPRSGPASEPV